MLRERLDRARATSGDGATELHRIAQWLTDQWTSEGAPGPF